MTGQMPLAHSGVQIVLSACFLSGMIGTFRSRVVLARLKKTMIQAKQLFGYKDDTPL